MKTQDWIIGLFIANCILFSAILYNLAIGCESCEMYDMYFKANNISYNTKPLKGYYNLNENSFYCVWTKGETEEEIVTTENHEICHALVYREPEHFCKRFINKTYKKCNSLFCRIYKFDKG